MSSIRNHGCPFCAPPASEVVVETAGALVLTDARPLCPGHVLVIPTVHVASAVEAPNETALFRLAHEVANALVDVMGEAGIYEHGGHPVCRHGTCRSGPIHAHLHVLPFREDVIGLWADGMPGRANNGNSAGRHYLLQAISSAPAERLALPDEVPPHFIRTLLSRAMGERGRPWLPAGSPPSLHRRATLTTARIFTRVDWRDGTGMSRSSNQAA